MRILHLDLETFSACNLKTDGLYKYARHPTTGIHVAAFAFDNGPIRLWIPGEPVPADVVQHIESDGAVMAHNAPFEMEIIEHVGHRLYGWPKIQWAQMHCTMSRCYAMALPGSLERAAPSLGIEEKKDMEGNRVMMKLAKPKDWVL